MKKGKKIWNRLLSLVLCLVIVTGMFAGMGMEAEAAKKVVHDVQDKKGSSGQTVTIYVAAPGKGTNSIAGASGFSGELRLFPENKGYDYEDIKAGDRYSYDKISRVEVSDEYDFGRIWTPGESGSSWIILLLPNGTLNVTVKEDGTPLANQTVKVSSGATGKTDANGNATFKVRNIWEDTKVSTSKDGYTYSETISGSFGTGTRNVTLNIISPKDFTVKLKDENGNLIKGNAVQAQPGGNGSTVSLNQVSDGTYTGKLRDGIGYSLIVYTIPGFYIPDAGVFGYYFLSNAFTPSANVSDYTQVMQMVSPAVDKQELTLDVDAAETLNVTSVIATESGITYSWVVDDPTIVALSGNEIGRRTVTALKAGNTNIKFTATHGTNVKTVTIPVTVTKIDSNVSVTGPEATTYGTYEGNLTFTSDVSGAFLINDKTINVTANAAVTETMAHIIGTPSHGDKAVSYTFTPSEADKYTTVTGTLNYTVNRRNLESGTVSYTEPDFTYDGTEKRLSNIKVVLDGKELVADTDYSVNYSNNDKAGNASLIITGTGNYTGNITKSFNIKKAQLSINKLTAKNREYDGTTSVQLTGIELNNLASKDSAADVIDLSSAKAEINDKKKGSYASVKAVTNIKLKDTSNYTFVNPEAGEEFELSTLVVIAAKNVTIENVVIESTKVYDGGTAVTIKNKGVLSENFDGEKVVILQGFANYDNKNVGDGKSVTFSGFSIGGEEAGNYFLTAQPESQTASITQKPLQMVEGSANVKDKVYDGTTSAEFSGTPALNSADIVENDDVAIDYGSAPVFNEIGSADEEKSVTVTTNLKITGTDAANYSLQIPTVTAKITNYTAVRGTDYTVNSNDWMNEDFVITAGDGCLISEGSQVNSQWLDKLTVTCDDDKSEVGTKAFYVKRADGTISRVVNDENAEYRIDKIDPTGEVKFAPAENAWVDFINTITFDLFYKDAQEVIITSHDQENLSGVASVEWYESLDKGMTLDEVKAITDWKDYDGSLIVALKDTKKFVYYVKITDKAGNVTYLSTDGAVYDITNPAITGIVNGETYYTTQVANVSDTNLKEVTLNSTNLTITDGKLDPITLEGNVDTEVTYTIVATDKAGNETTVSITMKPLSDLAGDITDSNVALEDEKELEKAEQILEEALKEENLPKITEEEEKAIREKLDEIQELLQELDEVKTVIKMIANLPDAYLEDGETVNPYVSDRMDDEEQKLYSAVKAAYNAYNKLSAHQQSLISTSLKHNLSNLRKVLTDYRIIDGDGKVWIYDTNGTITFTANGPVCRFENALVDGKAVPAEEMKVTKGSTVVELDAGYLYRLGIGNHTFQMEYTDGSTDIAEFSIVTMEEWNTMMNQSSGVNKTGGVATGDSANILLWGAVLAVGAAGMVVAKKRRKDEEA